MVSGRHPCGIRDDVVPHCVYLLPGCAVFGVALRLRTRRTTRIASVNIASIGGIGGNEVGVVQLTFSPNGRRLAYVAGTRSSASLYLVDLP